jgi:hypothetical protein
MRRLALAATTLLLYADPILAQSQVQQLPRSTPETATAHGPIPNPSDPTHPSTPNPAAPLHVLPQERMPLAPLRPAAPDHDQLTGHLHLGAAAAYGTFTGSFLTQSPIGSNLGGSAFVNIDLGYGLSRQLELLVAADYSNAFSGSGCTACNAKSWAIGPMLRYHLVEGTRFDPWIAFGLGYRHNSWNFRSSGSVDAIDFTRIAIGGDWFMTSQLAIGPILGCAIASSYAAPAGDHSEIFALFYAGLRITLDLPGH